MARVNLGQMYAEVAGRTALWDRPSTCGSLALQACEPPCVCQCPTVIAGLNLQIWSLRVIDIVLLSLSFQLAFWNVQQTYTKHYIPRLWRLVTCWFLSRDTWCGRRLPAGHSGTRSSHETGCNGQGLRNNAEGSSLSLRQMPMMIYESTIAYLHPLWSIIMVYHHDLSWPTMIRDDLSWSICLSVCQSTYLVGLFFWVCAFKITNIGDS